MFSHNLKIAFRNLAKYRLQTIIGILSVALGMVFCSLTYIWIRYERSFDTFHRDADNIYLVMGRNSNAADHEFRPYTSYPEGDYLAGKYPQIEEWARCEMPHDYKIMRDGKPEYTLKGVVIDGRFQNFFDIKVLEGESILNLSDYDAAITLKNAELLFGGDAIGKTLFTDQGQLTVKAVIDNPMEPTSIYYDFLKGYDINRYNTRYVLTSLDFVRVSRDNVGQLADMIANDTLLSTHSYTDEYGQEFTYTLMDANNYKLVPITKLRQEEALTVMNLNVRYIIVLLILGLVMIVCSLTNYFTMLVTRIGIRMREISLRYANGATTVQILRMFIVEISVVLVSAIVVGAFLCIFSLPYFTRFSTIDQPFGSFIGGYMLYAVAIGGISVMMASVITSAVSKRQLSRYLGHSLGRVSTTAGYKMSIGFQLAISLCAIFCTVVMQRQINFMIGSRDMGYVKHNIGSIYQFGLNETEVDAVREQLKQLPEMDMVVYGFDSYFQYHTSSAVTIDTSFESMTADQDISVIYIEANRDYLDMIEIQPVAGELFNRENEQENAVVISETLANMLGGTDQIVGKTIFCYYNPLIVKGVIKDVCYTSPKDATIPLVYKYDPENSISGVNQPNLFMFRFKEGTDWNTLKDKITSVFESVHPGVYHVIRNMEDDYVNNYIKSELALGKFLLIITIVCIIIAVSGVFSIVSLSCERRRREIAVRKINGAKRSDVLRLFVADYLPVIIASAVVAFPVGTVIMHHWQSGYVRQAPIGVWTYILVLLGMIVFIGLIIFNNIRKALSQNPADVIKSE